MLRRKNSKSVYKAKCSDGVHRLRQTIKYRFENFIHKNKAWNTLTDDAKSEYKALHDDFIRRSAAMLREFEKRGGTALEQEIEEYLKSVDSERAGLESALLNV